MIDNEHINRKKKEFTEYVATFYTGIQDFDQNIALKYDHSLRVSKEIRGLGASIGLTGRELADVELAGLFHDIGRFQQFRKYRTGLDIHSVDHASLGVTILQKRKLLQGLEHDSSESITYAVAHHNKLEIPHDASGKALLYTRLLRDADKLDIWRIMCEYYPKEKKNPYIVLDLPDLPEIDGSVIEDLLAGRIVHTTNLMSLNDFKLLEMGWVYDINFRRTFELIREREYISIQYEFLPHTEIIDRIYRQILRYIEMRCCLENGEAV
jgi:putative nucleotidyltransferase with HDIG domain